MGPLATVKQELLVRCLDAWTPAALRHARRATYVDGYPARPAVVAATGVFTEFADVLAGHRLTVLLAGGEGSGEPLDELGELPEGLEVRASGGDLVADLRASRALAAPIFAYLDTGRRPVKPVGMASHPPRSTPGQRSPAPMADLFAALGASRAGETLVALDPHVDPDRGRGAGSDEKAEDFRRSLLAAGFRFAVLVELVDNAGAAQWLFFATSALRSLEWFKDALWAVDEYAGVRYRDPRQGDHPPLDISLEPHIGPLRRALVAYLAADGGAAVTVAQLREYALSGTLYRPADVSRALQPMLAAGQVTREPERGRLTPQTLIALPTRR